MEIWKPIPNYEGIYEVSSEGRIKSLSKKVNGHNGKKIRKEKIRTPVITAWGYYSLGLTKNKQHTTFMVHRIVALVFCDNPENKPFVNHKNAIKLDNRAENLEWCTSSENTKHAYDLGLFIFNHTRRDKKVAKFDKEGNKLQEFDNLLQAGKDLKVHSSSIVRFCKKQRKHKLYNYEYI